MAPIVEMSDYPCVLIGPVGVISNADVLDYRVNLDPIDPVRTKAQRVRYVVARSCADDQNVLEWRTAGLSLQQVNQRIGGGANVEGHHCLMTDVVDDDHAGRLVSVDGVIGRPTGFVLILQLCR